MTSVLSPRFLFRYAFPVTRDDRLPRHISPLRLELPPQCRLPDLSALEGLESPVDVRLAWNPQGIGIALRVRGKSNPPRCNPGAATTSDGLQVWIDTRCTQNVHRASRFCHYFCLLPNGGGNGSHAVGVSLPVPRAREDAPRRDPADLPVSSAVQSDGYSLEAWLPAATLNGFDPAVQSRLGFFFAVVDAELGLQPMSVGDDFPYASDPSLWATLELSDA
jgi:hypothetical protein